MPLAQQLLKTNRGVNGSAFFTSGMSSCLDPLFIDDRAYRSSMNTVNRGGVVQTRPGYRSLFELPAGRLQGTKFFKPTASAAHLVSSVAGKVYIARAPFGAPEELEGIQFLPGAANVYWEVATKAVQREPDGTLTAIEPRKILIMQDGGYTRAAYWDGAVARHLDPVEEETPPGGPMCWSGDRLWVARGNRLFASDISDPLSFDENTYAAEGGFFLLPENIVAMAEIPALTSPQLLVWTQNQTWIFQSGIRDRSTWKSTPYFQRLLFPDIGAASHRGVASQHGLIWWFSMTGLTNMNTAAQASVSSELAQKDSEMAVSKGNISPNVHSIAMSAFENYLLCSVPSGDKFNRHTWVMDGAAAATLTSSSGPNWNSFWTGTRPVEWTQGAVSGVQRIFHASVDYDGTNRVWEAFEADRQDNTLPITSYVETKTHLDFNPKTTGLDLKKFVFGELNFCEMQGPVSVAVYWAGTRGRYKRLAQYDFESTEGGWQEGVEVEIGQEVSGHMPQTRIFRTPAVEPKTTACGNSVESNRLDAIDIGFSLLIVWSGRAGLRAYRIFADPEEETGTGGIPVSETGPKVLVNELCG